MYAALDLASPAPTAGPLVLAWLDRARAGQTADRWKALGGKGMPGQSRVSDIFQHVARAPADERVDLDPLALGFEQRQGRARRALKTLTAGDPGVKSFHRLGEWADLTDLAAAVRIAGEQKSLGVFLRRGLGMRLGDNDIGQLKTRDVVVAIGERLGEVLAGVHEDDWRRSVDLRHHVQERGGVGAEARHQRDAAGIEILDREPQKRRGLELREARLEPRGGDLIAEQLDVMGAHQMSDPALRS